MTIAVLRIPARVDFRLGSPRCDTAMTIHNAALSMTKVSHMVLFGVFFLLTLVQFDEIRARAYTWSLLATAVLGLLIELEEGASRTGNCRLTDVLPDIAGAAVMGVAAFVIVSLWRSARPAS
jgi:hypothetical protein